MPARAGSRLLGGADLVDIAGLMAAGHPALQAVQAGEVPMHLLLQILSRAVRCASCDAAVWLEVLLMRQLMMQDHLLLAAAACRGAGTCMQLA